MGFDESKEIRIKLDHVINGTTDEENGIFGRGKEDILPSQVVKQRTSGLVGGLSAQFLVSATSQLLGATGNQQVASVISQGGEFLFTGIRAMTADPTAIATLALKLSALGLRKYNEWKQEQEAKAQSYNDLTVLKMQLGQIVIKSNTTMSYDRFGKLTLKDRK